jgi:DNA-binding beta-propeller fold protein YncE
MHQISSRCFRMAWCGPFAAAVVTLFHVPAALAQGQTFVANYTGDSITVYSRKATGDVVPSYTIAGQAGDSPHQIAINHAAGELIVANNLPYSVATYDLATGVRKRTIAGPATGLLRPTGVAVDEVNGEIYVANDWGNTITVYGVLAAGDVTPKRTIQSSVLFSPVGLAFDSVHAEIVVASYSFNSITTFDRLADGISTPKRAIGGFQTGLFLPQGIALDTVNDEIVVANSAFYLPNTGGILAFRRTATGDVAPIRRLEGNATKLCNPMGVAVDAATNELVVANGNFGSGTCAPSVTTYTRTATGDTAPIRSVAGVLPGLYHPIAAAITSASNLGVKVKATQSNVTAGAAISYSISAVANGGPVFNVSLADTLPAALAWSVGGPDVSSCDGSLPGGKLTCSFGNLAKGTTKTIIVTAIATTGACPGVSTFAVGSFNDGTADLKTTSSSANVAIKCPK